VISVTLNVRKHIHVQAATCCNITCLYKQYIKTTFDTTLLVSQLKPLFHLIVHDIMCDLSYGSLFGVIINGLNTLFCTTCSSNLETMRHYLWWIKLRLKNV